MSAETLVASRVEGKVVLRHDLENPKGRNVVNNTKFAKRGGVVVEVVRTGPKHTRVRSSLKDNGVKTFLVPTSELEGLTQFVEASVN